MNHLRQWLKQDPVLHPAALAFLVLSVLFPIAMIADVRTILGLDPWIKPQKFAISLAVFLGTMGWILRMHKLPRRLNRGVAWVLVGMAVVEVGLISMQSARGVRSHFNITSAFDGTVYGIMGVAVILATIAVFVVACMPLRNADDGGPKGDGVRAGIRAGEVLFLMGCAWGVFMSPRTGHSIGGTDGGPGLPYVNWSTQHGDTRVAHFLLLHGLQVMPLIGLLIDQVRGRFRRRPLVWTLCVVLASAAGGVAYATTRGHSVTGWLKAAGLP
jgi:cytochrome b561